MIDRLGRLGDCAPDRDNTFRELLLSSASNEWDPGQGGHRREITRHLLGRLAAYTRLNAFPLSGSDSISTSFLEWLSQECTNTATDKPKDQGHHQKKQKQHGIVGFPSTAFACAQVKDILAGGIDTECIPSELPKTITEVQKFLAVDHNQKQPSRVKHSIESPVAITSLSGHAIGTVEDALSSYSRRAFHENASLSVWGEATAVDICVQLLKSYHQLEDKNERANLLVLKWVPLLSHNMGSADLWGILFSDSASLAERRLLDDLVTKCMSCWDPIHIRMCIDWMAVAATDNGTKYSDDRMLRFLVSLSCASPCHLRTFFGDAALCDDVVWGNSTKLCASLTSIAIRGFGDASLGDDSKRCNLIPASIALILQIAGTDRERAHQVTDSILAKLNCEEKECTTSLAALLRIYLCRPSWMELGKASVRTALVDAVDAHSLVWMDWRSSLDDQLENMIEALFGGDLRLTRSFQDLSRNHPLLVLRKLPDIVLRLEEDATLGAHHDSDSRIVRGETLGESRHAKMPDGGVVRVKVGHWGFCYTETLWVALLDVLAGIHKEVLFNSGLKLGVLDMLGTYVKLISVQLELRSAKKAARLKGKLSECFAVFQRTALPAWKAWLNTYVDESEVRHLLISCDFLSPQDAIESLGSVQKA